MAAPPATSLLTSFGVMDFCTSSLEVAEQACSQQRCFQSNDPVQSKKSAIWCTGSDQQIGRHGERAEKQSRCQQV